MSGYMMAIKNIRNLVAIIGLCKDRLNKAMSNIDL